MWVGSYGLREKKVHLPTLPSPTCFRKFSCGVSFSRPFRFEPEPGELDAIAACEFTSSLTRFISLSLAFYLDNFKLENGNSNDQYGISATLEDFLGRKTFAMT